MHSVIRNVFVRRINVLNFKCQRTISNNVIKVDDFTLKSDFPYLPTEHGRLYDRMFKNASDFKDKVALVSLETNKTYTYSQLQTCISVFATSLLKKLRLQPRDIVAIALPNCPEYPVVAFGAIHAGCVITTVNPAYRNHELMHQLKTTKPTVVVTTLQNHAAIVKALNEIKVQAKIVVIDDPRSPVPDGAVRYSEIAENGEVDNALLDTVEMELDDLAALPFSSGTTGLPKGVQITYRNFLASLYVVSHERYRLASPTREWHQDQLTCVLPFSHIYGLVILLMGHLTMGCKLLTMANFKPDLYLNVVKNGKDTLLFAVPPLLNLLGKSSLVKKGDFKDLRYIFCGGAPLAGSDCTELLEKVQDSTRFVQGYALTETTAMGVVTSKGDHNPILGSCGDPAINVMLQFADPNTGELVRIGEPGEVLMRTPCLMSGYYKNPKATEESFTPDGYYKTGDLGVYKPEGGLFILDRLKELIKVKGHQVPPAELEGLLRSHPSVLDAGVVGKPNAICGEVPKAFVVIDEERPVSNEELKAFVAEKVSKFKQIDEIVFVDALPRTASGKILRKELKDMC